MYIVCHVYDQYVMCINVSCVYGNLFAKETRNETKNIKLCCRGREKKETLPRQRTFSPGWRYKPGLKGLRPVRSPAATCVAFCPGL